MEPGDPEREGGVATLAAEKHMMSAGAGLPTAAPENRDARSCSQGEGDVKGTQVPPRI